MPIRRSRSSVATVWPATIPKADTVMHIPPHVYYKHLATTRSTMLDIRSAELLSRSEAFVLVAADAQSAGRGQRGTSWESAAGRNLMFSLLCRPTFLTAGAQFLISEIASLAVVHALSPYAACRVKWPNDIYVGDRKICGMLIEHDIQGSHIARSIVGPGINVNQEAFLSDAPNPVSLRQLLGHDVNREEVLERFVHYFVTRYDDLAAGHGADIDREYRSKLYRREGFHPYRDADGDFMARIAGIEPCGRLVLEDTEGRRRHYAFKEVTYVLPSVNPSDTSSPTP